MMKQEKNMSYANLTDDQLRYTIQYIEKSYRIANESGEHQGLALALKDKIDGLFKELVSRIQFSDPCTTEADVRHFEGFNFA